jgi:hypothetical protein
MPVYTTRLEMIQVFWKCQRTIAQDRPQKALMYFHGNSFSFGLCTAVLITVVLEEWLKAKFTDGQGEEADGMLVKNTERWTLDS